MSEKLLEIFIPFLCFAGRCLREPILLVSSPALVLACRSLTSALHWWQAVERQGKFILDHLRGLDGSENRQEDQKHDQVALCTVDCMLVSVPSEWLYEHVSFIWARSCSVISPYLLLQLSSQSLQLSAEPVSLQVQGALLLLCQLSQRGKLRVFLSGRAQQDVPLRLQSCQAAAHLRSLLEKIKQKHVSEYEASEWDDLLNKAANCNSVGQTKSTWGSMLVLFCTFTQVLYFYATFTPTPPQYCTFYSTTFVWQL